jgi:hypothetical protein
LWSASQLGSQGLDVEADVLHFPLKVVDAGAAQGLDDDVPALDLRRRASVDGSA